MVCKLAKGVTFTEVDGFRVLINGAGDVSVLNVTAGDLLAKALNTQKPDDVARFMCAKYDVSEDIVSKDLEVVLSRLCAQGMIKLG